MTLVNAFEVAPDADEPFVGAWQLARPPGVLHRALRADVTFRFVEIARIGDAEAEPLAPADPLPTPGAPGRYGPSTRTARPTARASCSSTSSRSTAGRTSAS